MSSNPSAPRVAICVVTYNSTALIADAVCSLERGAAGVARSLVFADNASGDDTLSEIERHAPRATVVRNDGNLGYAAGVNAAVRAAGPQDAYLILNVDVRLDQGCVLTLYETLTPDIRIVVSRLTDARGIQILSLRRAPTVLRAWGDALFGAERAGRFARLGEIVTDPREYEYAHPTDWAEGSTQLIGADWEVCGEWDESYFLYSEEAEYDLRARESGKARGINLVRRPSTLKEGRLRTPASGHSSLPIGSSSSAPRTVELRLPRSSARRWFGREARHCSADTPVGRRFATSSARHGSASLAARDGSLT